METKTLLFALLRHTVCGEELSAGVIDACTPENLESVYILAKKHALAHVVAYALEGITVPPCEVLVKLKQEKKMAIYRYARMDYEFERICYILDKGKIPFIPLKGSVLRSLYPEPWMRSSCDIDILVKPDDLWNAVMMLEQEEFKRKGKGQHDVSLYAASGVHLELHYLLADEREPVPVQRLLSAVWEWIERKEGTESQYLIADEWFYLHHIAHMAKHFLGGGCGIRTVLDTWILNNRIQGNLSDRESLLKQSGLLMFAEAAEKLSDYWFSDGSADEDTVRFGDFVLNGGVYGTRTNFELVQKAANREKYIPFHRILLSYEDLRYFYPCLDKRPWLMPLCQILRWIRILWSLKKHLKKQDMIHSISEKEDLEMRKVLRYLGL